jgi:ectoine hydroxylase-related dioxygenase (phytanoyl-CoA dioxygenase family)
MTEPGVAPVSHPPKFFRNGQRILCVQELAQFKRQGFLKIEALASSEDILQVRRIIDRLYVLHKKEWGSIDGLLSLSPELKDTATYRSCLAIAKQVLGRTTMYACDNGLYKEPHGKHGTPWHQDGAFHGKYFPNNTVAFWIPLQDATLENGCMHYIPLHKGQILLPHRPYYPNDYRSVTTDGVDATSEVVCPLRVGDATIHGPLTLHSAMANNTDFIRRTWLLTFRPWGRWGFFAPSRLLHRVRVIQNRLLWHINNDRPHAC